MDKGTVLVSFHRMSQQAQATTIVVVVVAVSSLEGIVGDCSASHSPPTLFLFLFFVSGN